MGLKPQESGKPSHNPSGISKEKAALRRLFEKFVTEEGRFQKYLKRLDAIAMQGTSKESLVAIREFLDKCLGKDFHVTGDVIKDIKIEIITTKEGEGSEDKD